MLNNLKNVFFVISILISTSLSDNSCDGDGWVPFTDEKCLKVFGDLWPNFEAQSICRQNDGILAVIRTEEEQHLVDEYLKTNEIVDNIWIGLKKNNGTFKWNDGNDMKYNNWAKGRPLNVTGLDCAVISVDLIRRSANDLENYGKWLDVNCKQKNLVLCQRIQPWSLIRLQNIVIETRQNLTEELNLKEKTINQHKTLLDEQKKELDTLKKTTIPQHKVLIDGQKKELDDLKTKTIPQHLSLINSQKSEINNLKSNPVPIGFIYVQLSGQSEPNTLWPNTEWQNISPKYAGYFFRAEGGGSAGFGKVQGQQQQSIQFHTNYVTEWDHNKWSKITDKALAKYMFTGGDNGGPFGINFKQNTEEIRPHNQAIRIWQRIKPVASTTISSTTKSPTINSSIKIYAF